MIMELVRSFRKWLVGSPEVQEELRVEMLVRSHPFKQQYKRWISKNYNQELLKNIYTSYTLSKLSVAGDLPLNYFTEGKSHHILLHYIDPLGKMTFPFLQDYLRDKIIRIGYNLYLSDRRVIARAGYVDTIERHVLRPYVPSFSIAEKQEQLYGHVQVSVHYINDRPLLLQLTVEPSTEPDYNPPFSFDELAGLLFM
jgi:hypothetical protein